MQFVAATATGQDIDRVIESLIEQVQSRHADNALDLLVVFMSPHYIATAYMIGEAIRAQLKPAVFMACTAEAVIGETEELENQPAITLIGASLPDVTLTPFVVNSTQWHDVLENAGVFRGHLNAPDDTTAFIILCDPFTTPAPVLLNAFNQYYDGVPVIGGMASGGIRPGINSLLLDDQLHNSGMIGVALSGALSVDTIVSQGCRPIGAPFTITEADQNIIHRMEGLPPVEHIQNLMASLTNEDQVLIENGLFLGRAVNAETRDLGRGDFLIRSVIGIDHDSGSLIVGDQIGVGETVQFHLRDARTAADDLELLLLPQSFQDAPAGGILFSCNGRGSRLYDQPNGDIQLIQDILGQVPMAGFFAAGEIGPISGNNFLHGQTASLVLFRPAKPNTGQ